MVYPRDEFVEGKTQHSDCIVWKPGLRNAEELKQRFGSMCAAMGGKSGVDVVENAEYMDGAGFGISG